MGRRRTAVPLRLLHEQPGDDRDVSLLDKYLKSLKGSERTAENRREILTRMDRELPFGLAKANAEELAAWIYRPGWTASTQATYRAAVAAFFEWGFDPRDPHYDGDSRDNPMTWMPEAPRLPRGIARPVTDEQLRRILTEAADPYRLWSLIAAYQGLRCCEIAGLDREHVTEARLVVVRGKGGKARAHDTDPYVWQAVRDLPPGPVAVNPHTGERATAKFVSIRTANHFRRKLDLPGVGLHMLRHWLGCTVQAAYRDIRVTQDVLGHETLAATQIYTRATVEQQRAARATLPRLAG